ncbi:hypothetical protein ACK38X_02815 [Aeromonas veronii]
MSALDPVILNEVKLTQKAVADLASSSSSGPTEYPWSVFFSSSSWTVPDDGDYEVIVIGGGYVPSPEAGRPGHGGGGGGEPSNSGNAGGTGGGAGGVSIKQAARLLKGQSVVVTVGAAIGRSSVVCAAAGLSMTANGASGSSGGSASGGDMNFTGGNGGSGTYSHAVGNYTVTASGGGGGLFTSHGASGVCFGLSYSSGIVAKAASSIGGDGGHFGGGAGVALAHAAYSYSQSEQRYIVSSNSASQGKNGDGGWLNRIPGYKSSGTGGEGLVAIRRVR